MEFADGTHAEYTVPIIKIQQYTKDEIFRKKLYFLLPFYVIRYERDLMLIENTTSKKRQFLEEFEEIIDQLRSSSDLDAAECCYLLDCIHRIASHILRKTPDLKERIDNIMDGKVLRLRTDVIIEQSLQKGLRQGKLDTYIELIRDGLISITTAATRLGMSEEELNKHMM